MEQIPADVSNNKKNILWCLLSFTFLPFSFGEFKPFQSRVHSLAERGVPIITMTIILMMKEGRVLLRRLTPDSGNSKWVCNLQSTSDLL